MKFPWPPLLLNMSGCNLYITLFWNTNYLNIFFLIQSFIGSIFFFFYVCSGVLEWEGSMRRGYWWGGLMEWWQHIKSLSVIIICTKNLSFLHILNIYAIKCINNRLDSVSKQKNVLLDLLLAKKSCINR